MNIRKLYTRLRSVDPVLTAFLSLSLTGAGYRICPQYPNMVLSFLTIEPIPVKWINLGASVLILVGGVGALFQYGRKMVNDHVSFR